MTEILWVVIGILGVLLALALWKIHQLHAAAREIAEAFAQRLSTDTNTLIDLSTRDRQMCRLAAAINTQLRELRRQRQRYCHSDRELKTAVTNISHDLRTPLTAICGYLELMEQEELPPDAARYRALIANRAQSMKQLTEELFRYSVALSAERELKLEALSLNDALEQSVADFYAALRERGITPQITLPEQPVVCLLDRMAMARVLENILYNAIKYSAGDLSLELLPDGTIRLSNTAPQLDQVQVGRLFDRYFTVESAQNATGLGLAIAKTLVEQMHGSIDARYCDGRLLLTIQFPVVPPPK